jgi:hypothetical protein
MTYRLAVAADPFNLATFFDMKLFTAFC